MKTSSTLDMSQIKKQVAAELADAKNFDPKVLEVDSFAQLGDDIVPNDIALSDDEILAFSSQISGSDEEKPKPKEPVPVKKEEPKKVTQVEPLDEYSSILAYT